MIKPLLFLILFIFFFVIAENELIKENQLLPNGQHQIKQDEDKERNSKPCKQESEVVNERQLPPMHFNDSNINNRHGSDYNHCIEEHSATDGENRQFNKKEIKANDALSIDTNHTNKEIKDITKRRKCGRYALSEPLPSNWRTLHDSTKHTSNEELEDYKAIQNKHPFSTNQSESIKPNWRILPGIVENPAEEGLEDYKLFPKKHHFGINEPETATPTRRIIPGFLKNPKNISVSDGIPPTRRAISAVSKRENLEENNEDDFRNKHLFTRNVQHNYKQQEIIPNERQNSRNNDKINELQYHRAADVSIDSKFIDPTKGDSIFSMKDTNVVLLENSRVCYACTTMTDPTCWTPDKRTTVKYCQKGHQSCLTKTFKHKGKSFIIRDCGSYCVSHYGEKYSTCSVCHSDLCNSASPQSIKNMAVTIALIFVVLLVKY